MVTTVFPSLSTPDTLSPVTRLGLSDTIAAIATAPGHAGVGIVRVSGPEALSGVLAAARRH